MGGVMSTVGSVLEKALLSADRRRQTWWRYVVENKTDEEFERTLEYDLNEEHGDVILEGLRAAISTIDSAALPALGRLTRMYLRTSSGKRDRFFRCCTRMFCDIDGEEIEQMRKVVVWSLNVVARDEFLMTQRGSSVLVVKDEHQHEQSDKWGIHATIELDASRVFDLLAEYSLLRPSRLAYVDGAPPNIVATRAVFTNLRYLITGNDEF
jgi:hypothetical protein